MPDLSSESVRKFWSEYDDQIACKAVSFMESVEDWSLDGNSELEKTIVKLGSALDDIGYVDLQAEDKFIQATAYIKIGRMLRLLQCMDTAHPGAATQILAFAKTNSKSPDDIFGLFLRRNIVFERLHVLGRVFAADRMAIVLQALGDKSHA